MKLKNVFHNRLITPVRVWRQDARNGNVLIGVNRFLSAIFKGTVVGIIAEKKVQKDIKKKLYADFCNILESYKNDNQEVTYNRNTPVWVLWMQGYDNAPLIVKKCIDSIRASTNHPVKLITLDNISEYYDFPENIKEKYQKGLISNAQFSDIIRMTLLAEYGGLWVDATIFIPNEIPENVFQTEFFTCKREIYGSDYVSEYRWTSFLNGCQKGCKIQRAARDLFFAYWNKYDYLIDYLLVDYVLLLIYENIPKAKKLIDELPYNNPQIEEMQNRMDNIFYENEYQSMVNSSNTHFFKLSWRMKFKEYRNGKQTYFGWFLKGYKDE